MTVSRIAITGHRPPRLGLSYSMAKRAFLEQFAFFYLNAFIVDNCEKMGVTIYNGGAQGWDQAVMSVAVKDCSVVAAIPFKGHESKWPQEAQSYYRGLLDKCQEVKYFGESYSNKLFAERDRWMVDQSDHVLALYDGINAGGTALTVNYALSKGIPVTNLWEEFVAYREKNLGDFHDYYQDQS